MKLIRVLHIVQSMNRGGIETMLMNFYRNIDRNNVQFDFLMTCPTKSAYEDEIISLGGRVFKIPSLRSIFKYMRALNLFFQENRDYKIVHSHIAAWSTISLSIAKKNKIPVRIAHSHQSKDMGGLISIILRVFKIPLKNIANIYFACGEDAANYLYGKKWKNCPDCYILNNAIDLEMYTFNLPIREKIRNLHNIQSTDLVIGHVGSFCIRKNQLFLLDLFKIIHEYNPHTKLICIGNGELYSVVEKRIKDLHLTDSVILTGIISNPNEYLQAMDVFVFPSFFEGLSVATIEAQTAGLKCFISSEVDLKTKITDSVQFLPLSLGAEGWAKEIMKIPYPYLRKDISSLMREKGYDVKLTSKWLENFYLNLLP